MHALEVIRVPFSIWIDGEQFYDKYDAINYARALVDDFECSPTSLDEHIAYVSRRDRKTKYEALMAYAYALPSLRVSIDTLEQISNQFFDVQTKNNSTHINLATTLRSSDFALPTQRMTALS